MNTSRLSKMNLALSRLVCLFTAAIGLFNPPEAPAQSAGDFKQLLAELTRDPKNAALRERVIKEALKQQPRPELPEAARRHTSRGEAAIETAKTPADWEVAVKEFEQAVGAAPWSSSCYYNLATVQEHAERPGDAMQSFKFYLLADPEAKDAEAVKSKIYKLEFLQEKAQKDAVSRQTEAQRMQREKDEASKPERLSGTWRHHNYIGGDSYSKYQITVTGDDIEIVWSQAGKMVIAGSKMIGKHSFRGKLEGNNIAGTYTKDETYWTNGRMFNRPFKGTVSPEGTEIRLSVKDVEITGATGKTVDGWRDFDYVYVLRR
jgi:hypothetical protein